MAYTHLTAEERYHIYELKHEQMSVTDIAAELGRSKSTISRELSRNAGHCGYRPNQAQTKSDLRLHVARGGQRVAENTWQACKKLLRLGCSPEQAAGRCAIDGDGKLSHEWIYQRIYEDKRSGGNLWQTLRCQKKRRKRYGSGRTRRGLIPGRVGIEQRCPRVEARATVGHWEADTVIGRNHKHALVTLVERKTGFGIVRWVTSKDSQTVAEAIIEALRPLSHVVRTITFDNGMEFAKHAVVAAALDAKTYFADPYSSWQRGTNENWNGLLRQYFPKKSCFADITDQQLQLAEHLINHRPRKRLAWRTPAEVFSQSATNNGVALAC